MIKYRLEGQYLEQFEDETFAISKAISKIGEIDARHGDVSTNFKIPLTAYNAKLLRYLPELKAVNGVDSFSKYNGQIVENEAVISDGYYQVLKFNEDKKTVELRFFGGNSNWFDLLKDRFINDVISVQDSPYPYDLKETNHSYNKTNVVDSWDFNKPYFYSLRDNGSQSYTTKNNQFNLKDFGISYFQSYIFKKIFDSVGIRLEGSLFNDPLYHQTVIASDKDIEDFVDVSDTESRFIINSNNVEIKGDDVANGGIYLNFFSGSQNPQWSGNKFTADKNIGTLEFDLSISLIKNLNDFVSDPVVNSVNVHYSKNGGAYSQLTLTDKGNSFDSTRLYERKILEPSVTTGDTFDFKFSVSGQPDAGYLVRGEQYSSIEIIEQGVDGYVTTSDLIPKVKQTDFIKDVMFRHGVVSQYDQKTKTLTLDKYEDIDNNILNAKDWTKKVDKSNVPDVDLTTVIKSFAKRSIIEYTDDTDKDTDLALIKAATSEGLGNGVITIDNDFLSDEKTIYKSPFSATSSRWSWGDWYIPFLPSKKISGEDNGTVTFENNEIKPRILIAKKISVASFNRGAYSDIEVLDGSGDKYSSVGYTLFTKVKLRGVGNDDLNKIGDNLMFNNNNSDFNVGNTLLDNNYKLYKKVLDKPYYVPMYLNLNSLDVQQMDFLTPVIIKGSSYIIDSLEQYKGDGTTTKVNLIKF